MMDKEEKEIFKKDYLEMHPNIKYEMPRKRPNSVGNIIETLAVLLGLIGLICGIILGSKYGVEIGIIVIVLFIIDAIFLYATGEICVSLMSIDNKIR